MYFGLMKLFVSERKSNEECWFYWGLWKVGCKVCSMWIIEKRMKNVVLECFVRVFVIFSDFIVFFPSLPISIHLESPSLSIKTSYFYFSDNKKYFRNKSKYLHRKSFALRSKSKISGASHRSLAESRGVEGEVFVRNFGKDSI